MKNRRPQHTVYQHKFPGSERPLPYAGSSVLLKADAVPGGPGGFRRKNRNNPGKKPSARILSKQRKFVPSVIRLQVGGGHSDGLCQPAGPGTVQRRIRHLSACSRIQRHSTAVFRKTQHLLGILPGPGYQMRQKQCFSLTVDPRDEKSFELARNLLDVLLDNSDSGYINVNMDEPFELGMGKSKEYADRHGKLSLYFDYMKKLHSYCLSRNRKMMMWGDEVLRAPEYVSRFPKDVILLDWIYEGDAHFEEHARLMQSTGLQFCLCPGTSSWGSLTGRSANMACNIRDAASCAIRYGGLGIITTDWGDQGHWQYISASYPAFAHTGLYAWSGPGDEDSLISWYCNCFLYESPDESAYQAAWDLGNYYRLENAPLYNTTLAFAVMSSKYTFDSVEEFDQKMDRLLKLSANIARSNKIPPRPQVISIDYDVLFSYLEKVDGEIEHAQILCPEGDLIRQEMKNGLRMVRHGIRLYHALKELRNDSAVLGEEMKVLYDDLDDILKEHYRLWSARNRSGGFGRSTNHMNHLLEFYRRASQP